MTQNTRVRRGFTLIELLVVIAIMGILAGLLMMAVQQARAAARQVQCVNNLKQMGIALNSYESAHKAFPPAKIYSGSCVFSNGGKNRVLNTTGFTLLLSDLEQQALSNAYNFSQASSNSLAWTGPMPNNILVGDASVNSTVVGTLVNTYACPADQSPTIHHEVGFGAYSRQNARRSNYLLCSGVYTEVQCPGVANPAIPYGPMPVKAFQGAFYNDLSTKIRDFGDGLSSTCMVGESVQLKLSSSWGPYWGAGSHTSTHGRVVPTNYPFGNDAFHWLPNAPWTFSGPNPGKLPYAWVFSSKHKGGVNMLFGDGSVKFIKDSISVNTWAAINTIRNGEVVSADSY